MVLVMDRMNMDMDMPMVHQMQDFLSVLVQSKKKYIKELL